MEQGKLIALSDAAARLPEGASLAVGGDRVPMALLRALLWSQKRLGRVYSLTAGPASLLTRSGRAEALWCAEGGSGGVEVPCLADQFRAAVEGRDYALAESSQPLLRDHPETFRRVERLFSGGEAMAAAALRPDAAILHVHRADTAGNAQLDPVCPMDRGRDALLARAARLVIVSAEQIVSPEAIRDNAAHTLLFGAEVDWVVEAPYGSYPQPCPPRYRGDAAAPVDERGAEDWYGCLERVGLARLLALTENRRGV